MVAVSKLPHIKAIVDAYTEAHGSNDSWVSERMGMSRQALSSWWNDGLSTIPSPYLVLALARATRTPYRDVLDAALADFMYLPESVAETAPPPARLARKRTLDEAVTRELTKPRPARRVAKKQSSDKRHQREVG